MKTTSMGMGCSWAAPALLTSGALAQGGSTAANDKILLAHIGMGGQGRGLMEGFLQMEDAQIVATCDPFKDRRESAAARVNEQMAAHRGVKGSYRGCTPCNDFRELVDREDIDAFVIATPDHWHVPIALAAVNAGKDVYVEKPLGISIAQDKALRSAVHRKGAVFQYGTQQRSFNPHCALACELVRNGALGELQRVDVVAPDGGVGGDPTPQPVPEGLDYDLWLGPAPEVKYTADRVLGLGRWFVYDYSIGFIAGWGAHPLDIAHWGYPHIPIEYEGEGVIPRDGLFDTVVHWTIRGRYASGISFSLAAGSDKTTFTGTRGWISASRSGVVADPPDLLRIPPKPGDVRLLQDTHHYRNFLTCVRTRSVPASDIDSAVQSDCISHLGDIAIRTGRKIRWDPVQETILEDAEACRMLSRPMREPWHC